MKVIWVGTNDERKHCRHHHALRLHMRDTYGVTLAGPGYSWKRGTKRVDLLKVVGDADVCVLDMRGSDQVGVTSTTPPDCTRILIERDYHNKPQWGGVLKYAPHIILGSVLRAPPPEGLDPWKQKGTHVKYDPWVADPRWRLFNYPVDTSVFYPGSEERDREIALFGVRTVAYRARRAARGILKKRKGSWLPNPTLIRQHKDINPALHYHDKLADGLRRCKMLWVDGANRNIFLGKYNEGIASGCLLVGVRPFGWDKYYPDRFLIETEPEDIGYVVEEWLNREEERKAITEEAWEYCVAHHSVEARGRQAWEVLEQSLGVNDEYPVAGY